jgi:hypothetical protein
MTFEILLKCDIILFLLLSLNIGFISLLLQRKSKHEMLFF